MVNIGSGLVVWLGFKRPFLEGVENFAINTAVTEAQIWSQPVRAIRDYKRYCREYQTGRTFSSDKIKMNWYVTVYPGGAKIDVWF